MLNEITSVTEGMPSGADDTPRILALPEDVLIRIVRFLGPQDVVIFGSVCKRFLGPATEDRLVWAPICRAIVGSNACTSPAAWGAPSFQRLYSRLLRLYGGLLAGPWLSRAEPLGSLLLGFPSPPHIVGGIVVSLRLAELGVTVVPVFRVSYDSATDGTIASCLRGGNTFGALLRRLRQEQLLFMVGGNEGEEAVGDVPEPKRVHPAELQLAYEVEEEVGGGDIQGNGAGRGAGVPEAAAADAVQPDEQGSAGAGVVRGVPCPAVPLHCPNTRGRRPCHILCTHCRPEYRTPRTQNYGGSTTNRTSQPNTPYTRRMD
ncbi:F-box only protein 31 [Pleodorina starrii]|nr:F-box only protein 31 [Pleodorina starrii]